MSKFGQHTEKMDRHNLFYSDHIFYLTCKTLCEGIAYEEYGINSMINEAAYIKKYWKLLILFSKSTQVMEKLKLAQQLFSTADVNSISDSTINLLFQVIVAYWWSTRSAMWHFWSSRIRLYFFWSRPIQNQRR